MTIEQVIVVDKPNLEPSQRATRLALFTEDGVARPLPSQAAAQADVAALTSAQIAGGEPPTQAEHNQVQADLAATRTVLNSLLAKLRTAGVIDT